MAGSHDETGPVCDFFNGLLAMMWVFTLCAKKKMIPPDLSGILLKRRRRSLAEDGCIGYRARRFPAHRKT
jgi:hypothetical protein